MLPSKNCCGSTQSRFPILVGTLISKQSQVEIIQNGRLQENFKFLSDQEHSQFMRLFFKMASQKMVLHQSEFVITIMLNLQLKKLIAIFNLLYEIKNSRKGNGILVPPHPLHQYHKSSIKRVPGGWCFKVYVPRNSDLFADGQNISMALLYGLKSLFPSNTILLGIQRVPEESKYS